MRLKRCGKSCRLRWLNYLRPDIKRGGFTEEEDRTICSLYKCIGSRWSVIASHLPGRTDDDVKNHWNTKLRKKLAAEVATSSSTTTTTTSSSSSGGGERRIRHSPSPSPPVGATQSANPENPADVPSSTPGYGGRFGSSEPTPFPAPAVDGVWNLGGTAGPSSLPADCSNSYSSSTTAWSDDEVGWVDALLVDLCYFDLVKIVPFPCTSPPTPTRALFRPRFCQPPRSRPRDLFRSRLCMVPVGNRRKIWRGFKVGENVRTGRTRTDVQSVNVSTVSSFFLGLFAAILF